MDENNLVCGVEYGDAFGKDRAYRLCPRAGLSSLVLNSWPIWVLHCQIGCIIVDIGDLNIAVQ